MEQFATLWKRKYVVADGFIKPDLHSDLVPYFPMEEYKLDKGPHLDLAALDLEDDNAIANFCTKWGLLGVNSREIIFKGLEKAINKRDLSQVDESLLPQFGVENWWEYRFLLSDHKEWENIDQFRVKAEQFKRMFRIKSAIFPKIDDLKVEELGDNPQWLAVELSGWLDYELENQIQLKTYFPERDASGNLQEFSYYVFGDLFTAVLLMLKMDLQRGHYTKQCLYRKCKKWFTTSKAIGKFCPGEDCKDKHHDLERYENERDDYNKRRREKYAQKKQEVQQ